MMKKMSIYVAKVLEARIERRKTASYWLAKSFRLGLYYVFKDEFTSLFRWIYTNFHFWTFMRTIAFAGFVLGTLLFLAILGDMLLKHEPIEGLPDKIDVYCKKMDSLLEAKIANL